VAELRIGDEVPILTVDRDVPVRAGDRQVRLQLVGLRVPGGVHVGDAGMHHFDACAQQAVDHAIDVVLVAGMA
jgi:NCAIR mutase (PurE)-related protein